MCSLSGLQISQRLVSPVWLVVATQGSACTGTPSPQRRKAQALSQQLGRLSGSAPPPLPQQGGVSPGWLTWWACLCIFRHACEVCQRIKWWPETPGEGRAPHSLCLPLSHHPELWLIYRTNIHGWTDLSTSSGIESNGLFFLGKSRHRPVSSKGEEQKTPKPNRPRFTLPASRCAAGRTVP
ncbi:hypothetical protein LX36DRAFT_125639 [Colletotrichum falcatum]|nr:hypothetical protein LX36DRAFT_125639 [Colletotrichum falcatum]